MTTKNQLLEKYTSVTPLSEELKNTSLPIVLYGTGNGADKIIAYLASLGKSPDAVFASDGFVRRRTFHDLPVESFDAVRSRYGRGMKILMCFGSDRAEVISRVQELDAEYDFALPDVPLYGEGIFDTEYLYAHAEEIAEVRDMLSDAESRDVFDDAVMYRLTGRLRYLRRTEELCDTYRSLLSRSGVVHAVDCGAYRGDTAQALAGALPDLRLVTALEPDPGTYSKLVIGAGAIEEKYGVSVRSVNCAASDAVGEIKFSGSSSRGAGASGKNRRAKEKTVASITLDSLLTDGADLVKLDVEGDEERALAGAERVMKESFPSLAVSIYHRTDDLWRLPLFIKNFSPEYAKMKYYIRRPQCIPCWDLTLYAVKGDFDGTLAEAEMCL